MLSAVPQSVTGIWHFFGHQEEGANKVYDPPYDEAEVIGRCSENGIFLVAVASFEEVAVHPVSVLDVSDDGFDSGPSLHFVLDGFGDAPNLPCDSDFEAVGIIVAAIAPVDMDTLDGDAG